MFHEIIIAKLEANRNVFNAMLESISSEQAAWKPTPDKWSILEVINHLHDEEVDDFRQRLKFALLKPAKEWIHITPEKWVKDKNYSHRDLKTSINNFLTEREKSIKWLSSLASPDWNTEDNYPFGKSMTAESILANWLAHDYLHIRQLNKLNYNYLSNIASAMDLSYAGSW